MDRGTMAPYSPAGEAVQAADRRDLAEAGEPPYLRQVRRKTPDGWSCAVVVAVAAAAAAVVRPAREVSP